MASLRGDETPSPHPGLRPGQVSPRRPVPADIPAPSYATSGQPPRKQLGTLYKKPDQIAAMRAACTIARRILDEVCAAVAVGMTTESLDILAHTRCLDLGVYPSPLNYAGFPKSICTSVNEVICHGIPDDRPLADGDIVNIDITVFHQGMHGDCSRTVAVGTIDEASRQLISVTEQALTAGIQAVVPGVPVSAIGAAIADVVRPFDYGVVRDFVGHGIGEVFHMDPQVPHYHDRRASFILRPGMTFTIEPMINQGDHRHRLWPDNWTAVTVDGRRSAQCEHTILVTDHGAEVLTAPAETGS